MKPKFVITSTTLLDNYSYYEGERGEVGLRVEMTLLGIGDFDDFVTDNKIDLGKLMVKLLGKKIPL